MKRWFALALLVALPVAAQDRFPRCRSAQGRSDRGFACDQAPFFEFAPASGAGLGAPCACAAVTGAKGETVTWTRGSSAMCTKSASETAIANGDLVLCASNQPRVMSLGGPLGVLVEASRTNNILQSQTFDNAYWTKTNATVTADFATAPDGTLTADRVQFNATTLTGDAVINVNNPLPVATNTMAVFLRNNAAGADSIEFMVTAGFGSCFTCNFDNTKWTRCVPPSFAIAGAHNVVLGNFGSGCGSGSRSAKDVLVWQMDGQVGAYMTSPIPTTTVAVTRSEDTDGAIKPSSVPGSVAATTLAAATTNGVIFAVGSATDGVYGQWQNATTQFGCVYKVGGVAKSSVVTGTINARPLTNRVSCSYDGANVTACLNGTCTSAAFVFTSAATTATELGNYYSAGFALDGIVSTYCEDPSPTRCR